MAPTSTPAAVIGLLPAAGMGRRLGRHRFIKELFPLTEHKGGELLEPRPVCDFTVERMALAGVTRAVVVLAPHKVEILRMLEGDSHGIALAYAVQAKSEGLPHAVRCAAPWLGAADVVLGLPDTLVFPVDALARVRARLGAERADLVLGVFPVDEPERLGPVDLAADGEVRRVLDKPGHREIANSWGVAAWSPRFTDFVCRWDEAEAERRPGERVLGHAFEAARLAGLTVRGELFGGGRMIDIGTPEGLRRALLEH
jgi:glucose-1-phosphate thymidylyltransferase